MKHSGEPHMNPPIGDPTNPAGPVTPTLAPSTEQSGSTPPVGPVSTQPSSSAPIAEIIDQYEKRHRALMSDKDKMANERDKAIAAQVEMQKQLQALHEQSQAALGGAAQTTQSAIDQAKALASKIAELEAENVRSKVLLDPKNADIAAYAQFIPASSDIEKVNAAVEQLKAINRAQLDRLAPVTPPVVQPLQNATLADLYAGRPGSTPVLNGTPVSSIPPSAPASMAPTGTVEDQNKAIESILKEASASGDPAKFAAALEEAKQRADMLIRGVVGASS
jgi:hypothetical protein